MRRILALAGAVLLGLLAAAVVVLSGMRARAPWAVDAVRRFSAVFKPYQMRTAGMPGAYASVIHHRGRTSGWPYETPVGAVATDDGFVIALPYGTRADWLKNVLASGSATIVHEGRTYQADQPEVLPIAAAADRFPASDRRSQRLFGIDQCLHLHRVEPAGPVTGSGPTGGSAQPRASPWRWPSGQPSSP